MKRLNFFSIRIELANILRQRHHKDNAPQDGIKNDVDRQLFSTSVFNWLKPHYSHVYNRLRYKTMYVSEYDD